MNHTVIFVHGFGVMKDARGMFTEIAGELSAGGVGCVLIDLNEKDSEGNILLNTLSKQADILQKTHKDHMESTIDLICHSQGCVVAAMADLPNIRKVLFLAPPSDNDNKKAIQYFSKNTLTSIDTNGISKLARRDGTFTIVPALYWKEKEKINLRELYSNFISHNDVYVVKASHDEVVSNDGADAAFKGSTLLELEANHDFVGEGRQKIILLCKELING